MYLCNGRASLFAYRRKLPLSDFDGLTQVVLCPIATGEVKDKLAVAPLRSGVLEGRFGGLRWVIVEANKLEVRRQNLAAIVYYATGEKLWQAVKYIVEQELREHYVALLYLRREVFKEVLEMKGKVIETDRIDIRGALDDFGLKRVIETLGVQEVLQEVGLAKVLEEVGLAKVLEEVGLAKVLEEVELEQLLRTVGLAKVREALRRLEENDG